MEQLVHGKMIHYILNERKIINQYVWYHIQYQIYTNKCLIKRWNIWFYWDTLKNEMTQNGKPHLLYSLNKKNWVHSLSGFRILNKQLKHQQYPINKINKVLFKLEDLQYATSLDLNIGYYHIQLTEDVSNICTIITPWRKLRYKCFPVGFSNRHNIFKQKII